MPISHMETCRIGGNSGFEAYCSGPCPNPEYHLRYDMPKENPAATWERGQSVVIHYSKNNHEGGFVRLALVPIDEMYNKTTHNFMSFFYACWSSADGYQCSEKERYRDCHYDLDNRAWKTTVTIPTTYPDGVYVLGWSWYGGGATYGSFGDYYDCSYVRIRGGPLTDTAQAVFQPGPLYPNGCQSSVDRLGLCKTEPCGSEFWSREMIPAEFGDGALTIRREWYDTALSREANQVTVAEPTDFGVTDFTIYDTSNEMIIDVDLNEIIDLTQVPRITIIPKYIGNVTRIEWVVNGKKQSDRYEYPFSIGGSQVEGAPGATIFESFHNLFDWPYPVVGQRVFVTAISHKLDKHEVDHRHYFSRELYFRRY